MRKSEISFFLARALRVCPGASTFSFKYNIYRHRNIKKKLEPVFESTLRNYRFNAESRIQINPTIWCFWWQGIDKMSPLVKKCYNSILRNSGKFRVILITEDNMLNYTTFSDKEINKFKAGKITLTHLSDLLRFNLLKNYGGLWMDLTLYVTGSLNSVNINNLFTCSGYPVDNYFNIAAGRWTGFFIGGPKNTDLFSFMDAFFCEYWETYDYLIDYFLIDYGLDFAWRRSIGNFNELSRINQGKNPNMFKLQNIINDEFDKKKFYELTKETYVFKLSNKKKINYRSGFNFFNNLS